MNVHRRGRRTLAAVPALAAGIAAAGGMAAAPAIAVTAKPATAKPTTTTTAARSGTSSADVGKFFAVDGTSAKDVWAVGIGGVSGTLIEHWNGVRWRVTPSPNPATGAAGQVFLFGVAAVSATDAWAVGTYQSGPNALNVTTFALILHWNGRKWSKVPCPCASTNNGEPVLSAVSAVSRNDVWAVGAGSAGPLILHFNGRKWATSPLAGDEEHQLNAVSALSANNVWAVGNDLTDQSGLTAHWNGRKWRWVSSPSPGRFNELNGVATVSSSSTWAVGNSTGTPKVIRWNGRKWSALPGPQVAGTTSAFFTAVSAAPDGSLWAVGQETVKNGSTFLDQTLTARWTGQKWMVVPSPKLGKGGSVLSGVYVASADNAWAVGGAENTGSVAGILHWDGKNWRLAQP
jgi:hypothetical protein